MTRGECGPAHVWPGPMARAVVIAVALVTAFPVVAHASIASVSGNTLNYEADPGEVNVVSISTDAGGYVIEDNGVNDITEGAGCIDVDEQHTRCTVVGVQAVSVMLDDGADHLTIADSVYPGGALTGDPQIQANGGVGNDTLTGGSGPDSLEGNGGNDHLSGAGGVDEIGGGSDDDIVDGGAGDDSFLSGAQGNDSVDAGPGNDDFVTGFSGNDTVDGGSGDDAVSGGADNDTVRGSDGNDQLDIVGADAASGQDTLAGGAGEDLLAGGPGNDLLADGSLPAPGSSGAGGPAEPDVLSGGGGEDTADYHSRRVPLSVSLDGIADDGQAIKPARATTSNSTSRR